MEVYLNNPLSYYGTKGRLLGEGAYGVVNEYSGGQYPEPVAIKFQLELNSSSLRELSVYRTVFHPNILKAIDMGASFTPDPTGQELGTITTYIVLPLARRTLAEWIELVWMAGYDVGDDFVKVMYQLVLGVAELHEAGRLVHNDLKSDNIFMLSGDHPVVADFGFAGRSVCGNPEGADPRTRGTVMNSSPELLFEIPAPNPAGDIWALGMIFYEILTSDELIPVNSEVEAIAFIIRRLGVNYDYQKISEWLPQTRNWVKRGDWDKLQSVARATMKFGKKGSILELLYDKLAEDLIGKMLAFFPEERLTIREVADHPYFKSVAQDYPKPTPMVVSEYQVPHPTNECFASLERFERVVFHPPKYTGSWGDFAYGANKTQTLIELNKLEDSQQLCSLTWELYGAFGREIVKNYHSNEYVRYGSACLLLAALITDHPYRPDKKDLYPVVLEILATLKFDTYRVSTFDYGTAFPPAVRAIFNRPGMDINTYIAIIMSSNLGPTLSAKQMLFFEYDVYAYEQLTTLWGHALLTHNAFMEARRKIVETVHA